jgi:hypothetical protein
MDNVTTLGSVAAAFGAETEAEKVDFVVQRLRAGAYRNHGRAVVDVLLQVNRFTAAHLDLWIDTLAAAFEGTTGGEARFGVPGCYLVSDDAVVDTTPLTYLVGRE